MSQDILESKVINFFAIFPTQARKVNVRPWGSYEMILSFDGQSFFHRQNEDVFGYGWSMEQAAAKVLIKYANSDNIDPQFEHWIGVDRLNVLKNILTIAKDEINAAETSLLTGEDTG